MCVFLSKVFCACRNQAVILTVKYKYEIKTRNRNVYDRNSFDDSRTYILG